MDTVELTDKLGRLFPFRKSQTIGMSEVFIELDRLVNNDELPDVTKVPIIFHLIRDLNAAIVRQADEKAKDIANAQKPQKVTQNDSGKIQAQEEESVTIHGLVKGENIGGKRCSFPGCNNEIQFKNQLQYAYIKHGLGVDIPLNPGKDLVLFDDAESEFAEIAHLDRISGAPQQMNSTRIVEIYQRWRHQVVEPIINALESAETKEDMAEIKDMFK